jgi:hypothetical protein
MRVVRERGCGCEGVVADKEESWLCPGIPGNLEIRASSMPSQDLQPSDTAGLQSSLGNSPIQLTDDEVIVNRLLLVWSRRFLMVSKLDYNQFVIVS